MADEATSGDLLLSFAPYTQDEIPHYPYPDNILNQFLSGGVLLYVRGVGNENDNDSGGFSAAAEFG